MCCDANSTRVRSHHVRWIPSVIGLGLPPCVVLTAAIGLGVTPCLMMTAVIGLGVTLFW
jgi:hypothetical protein